MHGSAYASATRFYEKYLHHRRSENLKILEVGSYDVNGSIRPIFDNPLWKYIGIDICPGPGVDVIQSNPYSYQGIGEAAFDAIVSSQTLEHVKKPWRWMPELARHLVSGGLIYICAPNTIHFHPYPIDCWRVYPEGLVGLFEDAGLTTVEVYDSGIGPEGVGDTTGIARKPM